MYAKERTLKPEKYSQKPSARNEAVLSERKKNKILGKLSLGDDPGGILGRTINFSSENVHREIKLFSPTSIQKESPYALQQSPLRLKTSIYFVSAAVLSRAI